MTPPYSGSTTPRGGRRMRRRRRRRRRRKKVEEEEGCRRGGTRGITYGKEESEVQKDRGKVDKEIDKENEVRG